MSELQSQQMSFEETLDALDSTIRNINTEDQIREINGYIHRLRQLSGTEPRPENHVAVGEACELVIEGLSPSGGRVEFRECLPRSIDYSKNYDTSQHRVTGTGAVGRSVNSVSYDIEIEFQAAEMRVDG